MVKVSTKLESVTKVTSGKKKTYLNEKYLPEGVKAEDATEVQKVKAFYDWVADPERLKENERLIAAGEEPNEPTGDQMQFLQRTGIQNDIALAEGISKIRQESVDIQQNAFDELEKEKTKETSSFQLCDKYLFNRMIFNVFQFSVTSVAISYVIAVLVILVMTGNWKVALISAAVLLSIISFALMGLVIMGFEMGLNECCAILVSAGMAVDYLLHMLIDNFHLG